MACTVLFTFDNEAMREEFINSVRKLANKPSKSADDIMMALSTSVYDPYIRDASDKIVSLFIAGKKIKEGDLKTINRLFEIEAVSHNAKLEIKEQVAGTWKTLKTRCRS